MQWAVLTIVSGAGCGLGSWLSGADAQAAARVGVLFGLAFGTVASLLLAWSIRRVLAQSEAENRVVLGVLASAVSQGLLPDDPALDPALARYIAWRRNRLRPMRWSVLWLACAAVFGLATSLLTHSFSGYLTGAVLALAFAASLGEVRRSKVRMDVLEAAMANRGASGGPMSSSDRSARRTRRERACIVVVALLTAGVGVAVVLIPHGGELHGPYGTFPSAITPPTSGMLRTGAAVPDSALAFQGLAIEEDREVGDDNPNRLSIADLRTGRPYWIRDLHEPVFVAKAVDAATGGVAVLTRSAGSDYRLSMFDLRSGRQRWRATVSGSAGAPLLDEGGVVVVSSSEGLTAFDSRTGRQRWFTRFPSGCVIRPFSQGLSGVLLVGLLCPDGSRLNAYEPRDGRRRWSAPTTWLTGDDVDWKSQGRQFTTSGNSLVVSDWNTTAAFDLTTGVLSRVAAAQRGELAGTIGGGAEVTGCMQPSRREAPEGLCAVAPATGRPLWQYRMPKGWELADSTSGIVEARGRVYVMAVAAGKKRSLLVVDVQTGRQLGELNMAGSDGTELKVTSGGDVVLSGFLARSSQVLVGS